MSLSMSQLSNPWTFREDFWINTYVLKSHILDCSERDYFFYIHGQNFYIRGQNFYILRISIIYWIKTPI